MTVRDSIVDHIDPATSALVAWSPIGRHTAMRDAAVDPHAARREPIRTVSGAGRARPVKGCASAACRGALDRAPTASGRLASARPKAALSVDRRSADCASEGERTASSEGAPGHRRAVPSSRPPTVALAAKEIARR